MIIVNIFRYIINLSFVRYHVATNLSYQLIMNPNTFSPYELANTIRIALLFGFRMLGLFMIFPILSTDATLNFSTTPMLIGFAMGIYGLTQATLQIPFGILSDQYGRKKIIVIGLLLFIIGSLIAATAENIWQLIIGRAIQGCGAIASVLLAYLADLTKAMVRIRAMAIVGMSIGCSFLLSLILGPTLYQWIGLSGLFYGSAIMGGIGFLLLLSIKQPQTHQRAIEYTLSLPAIKSVAKIRALWPLNITVMCIHACITIIFLFVPMQLIAQGIEISSHWKIYLSTMLISLIIALPTIMIAEKKQQIRLTLLATLVLLSVSFLIFTGYSSNLYLLGGLIVFFASFNILEALLPSSVSRIAPLSYRGMALGVFSSHQFLGAFLGGTLGGILLEYFSIHTLLVLTVVLIVLCLMLCWYIPMNIQKKSYTFSIDCQQSTEDIENRAKSQSGVLEALYHSTSGTLYVKTDMSDFNQKAFCHHMSVIKDS